MLETSTAPDWSESDVCMRCRSGFTAFKRKHHCRNCGQTFCQTCSQNNMPLPKFGLETPVRVCDGCYAELSGKIAPYVSPAAALATPVGSAATSGYGSSPYSQATAASQPQSKPDQFDEDLRKALELSLQQQSGSGSGSTGYAYAANKSAYSVPASKPAAAAAAAPAKSLASPASDEDDPELAAAIAASLKDANISVLSPSTSTTFSPTTGRSSATVTTSTGTTISYGSSQQQQQQQQQPPKDPNELTESDKRNITLFSQLIYKIEQNGDDIVGNTTISDLYANIASLHPRVLKNLEEADRKHRNVCLSLEMNCSCIYLFIST